MKPEQINNLVRLGTTLIPALNINLDDSAESGVYFQIMFEDGSLWYVTWGSDHTDEFGEMKVIGIVEYKNRDCRTGFAIIVRSWEEFRAIFIEKKQQLGTFAIEPL